MIWKDHNEKLSYVSEFALLVSFALLAISEEPAEIRWSVVDLVVESTALYASEYQEDSNIERKFFEGLPEVPAEINPALEQPLSLSELHSAVMSMTSVKAPRIYGISIEF